MARLLIVSVLKGSMQVMWLGGWFEFRSLIAILAFGPAPISRQGLFLKFVVDNKSGISLVSCSVLAFNRAW
ncbi:hypothetical protein CMI38_05240 [Candidatus Pacearchaeota archaeon]|nr:hypothetical protein [Candidatus Pacearchaeota archaeon]